MAISALFIKNQNISQATYSIHSTGGARVGFYTFQIIQNIDRFKTLV